MYLVYIRVSNKLDPFLARIFSKAKETFDFIKECGCVENEEDKTDINFVLEKSEEQEINKSEAILSMDGVLEKCTQFLDDYYKEFFRHAQIIVYRTDGKHMKEIEKDLRVEFSY